MYFFECKDRAFRPIYSQFPKTALIRIIANGYTLKQQTEASNWPIQKWNLRKFDKGNLRVLPGHDWRLLLDAITEPRPISLVPSTAILSILRTVDARRSVILRDRIARLNASRDTPFSQKKKERQEENWSSNYYKLYLYIRVYVLRLLHTWMRSLRAHLTFYKYRRGQNLQI